MEPDDTSFADGDTHDVDRECPQCGEHSVTTYLHHDTFTYGSGDTAATLEVVDLPVRRCGACDLEFSIMKDNDCTMQPYAAIWEC